MAAGFALRRMRARKPPCASPTDRIGAAEARPATHRADASPWSSHPGRAEIDLGGRERATFAYGNTVPGPLIRANVGDELAITVRNRLNHSTSIHWHGIALRNDMDGASPASPDIEAGADFTYRFSVPHAGTYWAHPHTGLDADTGLYLPIVVDDPAEPGGYDAEWIVVLDDWTDGIGSSTATDLRRAAPIVHAGARRHAGDAAPCLGWAPCPASASRVRAHCWAGTPVTSVTRTT